MTAILQNMPKINQYKTRFISIWILLEGQLQLFGQLSHYLVGLVLGFGIFSRIA